jgi:hypothetical protein
MATDQKSHVVSAPARTRSSLAQEEEVYSMLGALLGTLEVVATDDVYPLAEPQVARVRSAVQLCHGLQHQLEALLTLAADDLPAGLRRTHSAVRPLVEHAVRGAVRGFAAQGVELQVPAGESWGSERVFIDSSRVDRMLKGLSETLAASVGKNGAVEVTIQPSVRHVAVVLTGHAGTALSTKQLAGQPTLATSALLIRGATRLFELHGGGLTVDASRLLLHVLLPRSEAP